jgi:hypothetical protein
MGEEEIYLYLGKHDCELINDGRDKRGHKDATPLAQLPLMRHKEIHADAEANPEQCLCNGEANEELGEEGRARVNVQLFRPAIVVMSHESAEAIDSHNNGCGEDDWLHGGVVDDAHSNAGGVLHVKEPEGETAHETAHVDHQVDYQLFLVHLHTKKEC